MYGILSSAPRHPRLATGARWYGRARMHSGARRGLEQDIARQKQRPASCRRSAKVAKIEVNDGNHRHDCAPHAPSIPPAGTFVPSPAASFVSPPGSQPSVVYGRESGPASTTSRTKVQAMKSLARPLHPETSRISYFGLPMCNTEAEIAHVEARTRELPQNEPTMCRLAHPIRATWKTGSKTSSRSKHNRARYFRSQPHARKNRTLSRTYPRRRTRSLWTSLPLPLMRFGGTGPS